MNNKNIENTSLMSYSNPERFWRGFLHGLTVPLKLPVLTPSTASHPSRQTQEIRLSNSKTSDLTTFAKNNELSLYTLIQGSFALLLSHYTRETDILFGVAMGELYSNIVPLRVSVEPDASLLSWLKELQAQWSILENYKSTPLVQIQQWSEIPPGLPLFETLVIFGNYEKLGFIEHDEYPLILSVDTESDLLLKIDYEQTKFADDAIARMLGHLETLLKNIINLPEQTLADIPLLTEAERHQLLVAWNQTETNYPQDQCIHELFEEQVERTPDAVAVVFENEELTYRELNQRANQLANYLQRLGVKAEVLVGICIERSLEMIVGILGILKAGGAYVPLDIAYPKERLAFMLSDAQVSILLTQQSLIEKLPKSEATIICLDNDSKVIELESQLNLRHGANSDNLAYVMYTSGSTGQPKGVCTIHRGIVRLVKETNYASFSAAEVFLQLAPLAFDASTFEIWGSLLNGGRLVIFPAPIPTLEDLAQSIRSYQITTLWLTAGLFHLMVDQRWEDLKPLRQLLAGGDVLSVASVQRVVQALDNCQIINGYGPTENTTFTCCYRFTQTTDFDDSVPIGRPIANTQVYILNQYLQPVPIGVTGEIYVGGAGLARGYLNRPELTAERFISHPFSHQPEARIYKTGDLGRYLFNGEIEFLGRIDNQVKIRGFRIELGEIEAVLNQHSMIRETKVITREDIAGEKRLVAYIIPSSKEDLKEGIAAQLREYLKQKLPDYMVPSAFVVLDAFPLTTNGKIDNRALPIPDFSAAQTNYVAPRTPTEEIIANIWSQVLKVESIGIYDNFFELGGHSLIATQVISRIRQTLNREIPLSLLFESPTIAQLSQQITKTKQTDNDLLVPEIEPRKQPENLPLSFAQQRLWFLDQLQPDSTAYNIPYGLKIQGSLNISSLEKSLAEIIQRHEILHTNFIAINGQPTQVIINNIEFKLLIIDLQSLPEEQQESEIQKIANQTAEKPVNLAKDSLVRIQLLRLNAESHILLFNIHHIIFDGWSFGVLFAELQALYTADCEGLTSPLPQLPIQYADFTLWQRQWLSREVLESQLNYWKGQLGGVLPILELPTDRTRPKVQTYIGATKSLTLSPELTASIKSLSQQEGVTLFMTLLAAFKVLLCRYSGQEDVIVGTPIAGRNRREIEGLMGFFVNTLAVRSDLAHNPSFRELLGQVRQVCLEAYTHQDVPFEQLVEELQPERYLSHTPVFQVMFVLENAPLEELQLPGLSLTALAPPRQTAKFDLTLSMMERNGQLMGEWEYNTDLFDGSRIQRMMEHFQMLLSGILAAPNQCIWELPLLTEAERHQLLVAWNQTETNYPQDQCIHELFEEQVERTPDAVAVVFENEELTYRELNQRANQLANYLQRLGVKAEVLVGICIERSLEMIVGILGILKAGGAYVPLDIAYPKERLAFMLSDAQVSILLTQQFLIEKLPKSEATIICLDNDSQVIELESQLNLSHGAKPDNLAYVMYTSGSTGQPKGVAMAQIALCNLIMWQLENTTILHGGKTLQFSPISFDVSCQEIFATWSSGGILVLIKEELRRDALALLDLLDKEGIERLFLPFAALQQLTETAVSVNLFPHNLKEVITAGEQLQIIPAVETFFTHLSNCRLYNHYGPSESHVVTSLILANSVKNWVALPSIGRPISNTQIYILDSYLQPVPIGIPGELHIGGVGVARGYLNRPELTKEKFIADPFSHQPEASLYKTGDLARYLPNGEIEYLGRIDNQVKIRGFRIEIGEIETVLNQHPNLRESKVITREDIPGNKRLVAYIIPNTKENSTSEIYVQIREYLQQKLPDYMIPSAFVVLETFPLTPNGKIDNSALPVTDFSAAQTNYVAPRTPTEEIIANIWSQVLKVESIGIYDNFFELGGHSLLGTQVISRIRQTLNREIPLSLLFESPTIAQLSQQITKTKQTDNDLLVPEIEPRKQPENLPLSFAQQRLWFLDQLQPDSTAYNIPYGLKIQGSLNISSLEKSLAEIIQRHEILHTNFIAINGQPTQVIINNIEFKLLIIDLQSLPEEQQESEIQKIANQTAEKPVNLAKDSLVRIQLLRLNAESHILLFNIHHIIFDGWSFGVLFAELQALYTADCEGLTSPLPQLPIQYADFTLWQRQWLSREVLESQLNYWKGQLGGVLPILELPTDRTRPKVQTYIGATKSLTLSPELTASIKSLSQQEGVTLFMTLLAAFKVLLCRYSGQEDVIVGTPIAGRNRREIEGLMGFFVNTLAVRSDLAHNPSFRELLGQVRQVCLEAYTHQDVPFEQLVEELQPERYLSHTPVFQVMFVLENAPLEELQLPGLSLTALAPPRQTAKFDLTLSMMERNGQLMGEWEYNTDLFDGSRIQRMMEHFQMLLSGILAAPNQCIWELPLLTEAERHQLLVAWNQTETNYPQDQCIHELFEEQVERTPDAVAVVFENEELTYRELNQRANQLANYLQRLGVKAEVLVGICIERSLEMIVGILGILKAGGAYVPLDIAYPKERLAFMLSDAQVSILLTQQSLIEKLPKSEATIICLDNDSKVIELESQLNLRHGANSDNLAYVMYTSGSTGQPKGVCTIHRGIVRLVKETNYASFSAAEVFLQLAPLAFDASTFEIWGSLLNGGRLVIFPAPIPTLEDLAQSIRSYQITTLWLTAGLFHLMVDQRWEDLKPLRQLLAGGDVLSVASVQRVVQALDNCQIINGYGPTENTTFTCCYRFTQTTDFDDSVPIGRPIANTQVYILNQYLQPVPIGVTGEIYVGGAGLARGYLNRPELTAERFISHPFSHQPEARIYKTGDLGRYLFNGEIEFLGRIDNQVKIRGFRIELGEIEAVLNQHSMIRETKVITREDIAGEKRLVAYIIPSSKEDSQGEISTQLREYLKQKLPDYMVPSAFVVLDAFPLTTNGKIENAALPIPDFSAAQTNYVAPRTPTEEIIANIWSQVLKVESIGIYDNFFELGGHSLLGTQVLSRICQTFQINLSLRSLFETPTIAQLCDRIETILWAKSAELVSTETNLEAGEL